MKTAAALIAAGVLAACTSSAADDNAADMPGSAEHAIISENAASWLAEDDVPALAVAYIVNGEVAWSDVYGQQGPDTEATPDTLFNIASMTKPVTAETVLRLASSGTFSLDDPMAPTWVDPDIADDPRHLALTPDMALRHRTGFPNWREDKLEFNFTPGEKAAYSGEGYQYVARYAEAVTGKDFPVLAREQVFAPVGMDSAAYVASDDSADRLAVPKGPDGSWGEPVRRTTFNAADDVMVTIEDYARFVASVMKNERISPAIAADRYTLGENLFAKGCPWGPDTCPTEGGFSAGWTVFRYGDETIALHGGGDWGERTIAFFEPETGTGAVIFTNGANGSNTIARVAEVLYPSSPLQGFLDFQASN